MTDATQSLRSLRWFSAFAVVVFGVLPVAMVTLLVAGGDTPRSVGFLLVAGIPLILAAIVQAVRGMTGSDPELCARRLHLSMALVAAADVLVLGGNALIRIASA
jgi:hypothetical protein